MRLKMYPKKSDKDYEVKMYPSDTFSFDHTIAVVIYEGLKEFKNRTNGCAYNLTMEQWYDIIEDGINRWKKVVDDFDNEEAFQSAMKWLEKWHSHLWWQCMYVRYSINNDSESIEFLNRVSYSTNHVIINGKFLIETKTAEQAYNAYKRIVNVIRSQPSMYDDCIYDIGTYNVHWTLLEEQRYAAEGE